MGPAGWRFAARGIMPETFLAAIARFNEPQHAPIATLVTRRRPDRCGILSCERGPDREHPNILFLLSDDHADPFVGCYGDDNVQAPTLNALVEPGMKVHRFCTSAAGGRAHALP